MFDFLFAFLASLSPIGILFAIVGFIFVITIIVFVHEMGHFLVARWCGVTVTDFSLGFGRELIGFTDRKGTRWRISALPLGGYVKFLGDENAASVPDPEAVAQLTPEQRKGAFVSKSVAQRAAVVAAGPIANFILAIVVLGAFALFFGRETTVARIDSVVPGTAAAEAGFQPGDVVVSIDGTEVEGFLDVQRTTAISAGRPLEFVVERNGEEVSVVATPERRAERDRLGNSQEIGVLDIGGPAMSSVVRAVGPGSAAEAAGLEVGDRIVAVDGTPVKTFEEVRKIVSASAGKPLALQLLRDGATVSTTATPTVATDRNEAGEEVSVGRLGVSGGYDEADLRSIQYGPLSAIAFGAQETWFVVDRTFAYLAGVVTGRESADQLGGPLRVAQVAGQVAQLSWDDGNIWRMFQLAAFLSISIGLINLFPIPMLDGGHLLFYAFEAVLRRPLSERTQEIGFRIGFVAVIALMIFATTNDLRSFGLFDALGRLFRG